MKHREDVHSEGVFHAFGVELLEAFDGFALLRSVIDQDVDAAEALDRVGDQPPCLGFTTDVEFCRWLTSEIGVAAVPPSAFYFDAARAPLLARFCFAKRPETLAAAAQRLRQVQSRLAAV